jgi:hypothetical protein
VRYSTTPHRGAQPVNNQHNWRNAKKCACPERKALARKVAGILRAHFVVAERPCRGEAHSNPHIDHCSICAPRWGVVEYLTPAEDREDTRGRTLPPENSIARSWAPEVIADSSGKWCGNNLRFATKEEAEANVRNLSWRWMLVRDTRVIGSPDEPNYQWDVERGLVSIKREV